MESTLNHISYVMLKLDAYPAHGTTVVPPWFFDVEIMNGSALDVFLRQLS
jgi:hypothetical protein